MIPAAPSREIITLLGAGDRPLLLAAELTPARPPFPQSLHSRGWPLSDGSIRANEMAARGRDR
jgi:hypothetical protein